MKQIRVASLLLALGACQSVEASGAPPPKALAVETEPCGAKGQPDCPTQRWMKATLQSYQRAQNYERLAIAFDELATKEPNGYAGWADSAKQGAEAARKKDEAAVKASCRACHDSLRDRFKNELRHAVLF